MLPDINVYQGIIFLNMKLALAIDQIIGKLSLNHTITGTIIQAVINGT